MSIHKKITLTSISNDFTYIYLNLDDGDNFDFDFANDDTGTPAWIQINNSMIEFEGNIYDVEDVKK